MHYHTKSLLKKCNSWNKLLSSFLKKILSTSKSMGKWYSRCSGRRFLIVVKINVSWFWPWTTNQYSTPRCWSLISRKHDVEIYARRGKKPWYGAEYDYPFRSHDTVVCREGFFLLPNFGFSWIFFINVLYGRNFFADA